MRFFLFAFPAATLAALASCGGSVVHSTSSGTSTGGTSSGSSTGGSHASSSGSQSTGSQSSGSESSSSGTTVAHGCTSSADCNGGMCVPLTPGGFQVCLSFPPEATSCQQPGGPDQCCTSADCATMPGGGSCYASMNLQFCGGAQLESNTCVADQCQSDADCVKNSAPAICAPAGAFGNPERLCLDAYCRVDADCKAKPGGACVLVGDNPCCKNPAPNGLGCVYPGGCVIDSDCASGQACQIDDATFTSVCNSSVMGCPG